MSHRRPYTAVLFSQSKTCIVEMNASVNINEAQEEFLREHPGWELIALIAGSHESRSHSFDRREILRENPDRFVDPFDTSHCGASSID